MRLTWALSGGSPVGGTGFPKYLFDIADSKHERCKSKNPCVVYKNAVGRVNKQSS